MSRVCRRGAGRGGAGQGEQSASLRYATREDDPDQLQQYHHFHLHLSTSAPLGPARKFLLLEEAFRSGAPEVGARGRATPSLKILG